MPAPLHPTRTYDRAVGPSQVITLRLPPQTFTQSLTASLSFVGNFAKGLLYLRSFSATLFPSSTFNDDDSVSTWPDSSGNGNDATMTGSNRPTYKTAIVNGKPVVRFTSAGQSKLNLTNAISGAPPWIIFAVMKAATSARIDSLDGNAASGTPLGMTILTTNALLVFAREGYVANVGGPLSAGFHILDGIDGGIGAKFILIDGTADTGPLTASANTGNFTTIGYDSSTPTYCDGDIAEIIIYAAAISGTDRQNIEKYLGTKYGITVPAGTAVQPDTVSGLVGWWKADALVGTPIIAFNLRTGKALSAALSTIVALTKRITDSGFTATLNNAASLTKKYLDAGFTATLSFVGNLASSKLFLRALTATLSFTGAFSRRIGKAFSATLSFVAAQTKKITHGAFTAMLSFVGAITRNINKNLTATLSWIGNLATSFIAGGGHVFTQSLTATLSFVGAFRNRANKNFTPVLSFTAALIRRVSRSLTATLSFIGNLAKSIRDAGFTATLSFTGFLAASKSFLKSFTATLSFTGLLATSKSFLKSLTATLSFTGTLTRRIGKAFSATLSFIGNLATNLIHGAQTFFKSFTATLSPTATITKKYVDAGFTATLSFVGSVSTVVAHFFVKSLTATLSFVGTLTRTRGYARLLTATLNMSGAIRRRTAKSLAGMLAFSTAIGKAIRKGLAASLSFVVFFFRGGFTIFFAGQKAGSTVHIQVAGSSLHLEERGSTVQIQVAGSNVNIHRAGSQLTVERTE